MTTVEFTGIRGRLPLPHRKEIERSVFNIDKGYEGIYLKTSKFNLFVYNSYAWAQFDTHRKGFTFHFDIARFTITDVRANALFNKVPRELAIRIAKWLW